MVALVRFLVMMLFSGVGKVLKGFDVFVEMHQLCVLSILVSAFHIRSPRDYWTCWVSSCMMRPAHSI